MTGYKHLTARKRRRILELKATGKSEKEIARRLHVHRNTVYVVLKSANLHLPRTGPRVPPLTQEQEDRVLCLLELGVGTGRIAAKLGLRPYLVRAFAEKHGFHRKPTQWESLDPALRQTITEDILCHHNFGVDLAEKYSAHIGYKPLLKVAKIILKVSRFRPSRAKAGPFTSDWPQKHRRKGKLST